jgi:uncharacterized tellurite resistance protein B-like protein
MGTIAQIFQSGQQKANEGHFKNLVMLARVNGKVEESEKELLARIAKRLSLTQEHVDEILQNPDSYPMIPPISLEERIERFIQFVQMILVDGSIDPQEESLIGIYGIQLGFKEEQLPAYQEKIIQHLKDGKSRTEILDLLM